MTSINILYRPIGIVDGNVQSLKMMISRYCSFAALVLSSLFTVPSSMAEQLSNIPGARTVDRQFVTEEIPECGGESQRIAQFKKDTVERRVFLLIDKSELVACDAMTGNFIKLPLLAGENVMRSAMPVPEHIAVAITNKRFVAYSTFTDAWHTEKKRYNEQFISMQADIAVAAILTSRRILTFNGNSGVWSSQKR